jgi:hypothetical protein
VRSCSHVSSARLKRNNHVLRRRRNLMSDDTQDDTIGLVHPADFEDVVSQRAMAFCHVAKIADTIQDETVKEQCLIMLRKLSSSIKTPSTADLRSIKEGSK